MIDYRGCALSRIPKQIEAIENVIKKLCEIKNLVDKSIEIKTFECLNSSITQLIFSKTFMEVDFLNLSNEDDLSYDDTKE